MKTDPHTEYWREAFMVSMEEAGCWELFKQMTPEQVLDVAGGLEGCHDNYGMAFYSPPSSDRYNEIEREWKAKYERLEREMEAERGGAEKAIRRAYRLFSDTPVTIDKDGSVFRHGGRTTQIA